MTLARAVERLARHPFHPGVAVSVHGPGGEAHHAGGNLDVDTPCFFASATKLMVATVLHQLAAEGLTLDAPLVSLVSVAGLFPGTHGEGVMRFALPRWLTLFRRFPALYGHSGAALFHAPEAGVTIAASVNQVDRPGTVFRLILKAL
jgi:hypothetical protein